MKKRKTGFTLIEMLVVIAAIAMLCALLFPALKKARDTANRIVCQNNMKQIGLCLFAYADSYRGFLPSGWVVNAPQYHWTWPNLLYDSDFIKANRKTYTGDVSTRTITELGQLQVNAASYIDLFRCPRDGSKWTATESAGQENFCQGFHKTRYGLVVSLAWQMGVSDAGSCNMNWLTAGIRPDKISSPSRRALLTETNSSVPGFGYYTSYCKSIIVGGYYGMAYPHGSTDGFSGVGNVLCLDGHMETQTFRQVQNLSPGSGRYPYIGIDQY